MGTTAGMNITIVAWVFPTGVFPPTFLLSSLYLFSPIQRREGKQGPKKQFFCILTEERDGVVDFMMWYGWVRSGGLYFYLYLLSISLPWPDASGKYSNTVITKDGGCGQGAEDRVYLWDVVSRNPGTY